jgi:hypothetical protein
MAGRLFIDFCGEEYILSRDDTLTFGRTADLEVDTNPYLHRRLGLFHHEGGHWWVSNTGGSILLNVHGPGRDESSVVAPGGRFALTVPEFTIGFTAGPNRYEVSGAVEDVEARIDLDDSSGTRTLEWGVVDLNADQHLLLVATCERLLRTEPGTELEEPIPPSRACANRLGWSITKYNRKLDHLCLKFSRVGLRGLQGEQGNHATNRRTLLAEHAIRVKLVVESDLSLLDPQEHLVGG